jgi:carboxyl-terminal processing protease
MLHKKAIIIICLAASGLFAFTEFENGKYFDIIKNLEIFTNVYKEINYGYVDELDPGRLMRTGLDAMLYSLDPFTNYISETDIEGYRTQSEGRYNGVGATGRKMGDYVVITEIFENSAAHKAGIKVGDAIISIDGQDAKGRSIGEVMQFLRGFPGTNAELVMRRPGESKDLRITLSREEVDAPNVPHFGMVDEHVGYINLSIFSQDAGANVSRAFNELKSKNPEMKGVILDLRDNGGGLLSEAVSVSNVFLPKGEFIVSTKGKVPEWDREFQTRASGMDSEIPLTVLINSHSASASEIVCGSMQDLDRGVLLGQRSYGKGLVQNTKDVGYNSKLKLTTAKYYIPSGRCIQAVQYKDGKPVDIPEAQRAQFKTRNGRTVLDGGGVKPDIVLPQDTATGIVKALLEQDVIFDYVTQWAKNRESIDSIEIFKFDQWPEFVSFVKARNFGYESATEKKLKELRDMAASENYGLGNEIKAMETKLIAEKKDELETNKSRLIREIEQEIVGRYYFQRGKVRKRLVNDPEVEAAIALIKDQAKYQSILGKK